MNCAPLLALLAAEERALRDKTGDVTLYKDAIVMLGRCGFHLFKAITCDGLMSISWNAAMARAAESSFSKPGTSFMTTELTRKAAKCDRSTKE